MLTIGSPTSSCSVPRIITPLAAGDGSVWASMREAALTRTCNAPAFFATDNRRHPHKIEPSCRTKKAATRSAGVLRGDVMLGNEAVTCFVKRERPQREGSMLL